MSPAITAEENTNFRSIKIDKFDGAGLRDFSDVLEDLTTDTPTKVSNWSGSNLVRTVKNKLAISVTANESISASFLDDDITSSGPIKTNETNKEGVYTTVFQIPLNDQTNNPISITSGGAPIYFNFLVVPKEQIYSFGSFSYEDGELVARLNAKDGANFFKVEAQIHHKNFISNVTKVGGIEGVRKLNLGEVSKQVLFIKGWITFWDDRGNSIQGKVKIYPKGYSDLRKYRKPVEYTKQTQEAANAFPIWSDIRLKDFDNTLISRNSQGNVENRDIEEGTVFEDSDGQLMLNSVMGGEFSEVNNSLNILKRKVGFRYYPIDEINELYSIPLRKKTERILIGKDDFTIENSVALKENLSFGDIEGKIKIRAEEYKIEIESNQSEIFKIIVNGPEVRYESSKGFTILKDVDSNVSHNFSIRGGELTANSGSLFVREVEIFETESLVEKVKIIVSKGDLDIEEAYIVALEREQLVDKNGDVLIPVSTLKELESAKVSRLDEVKRNPAPIGAKYMSRNVKVNYYGKELVDKNGDVSKLGFNINFTGIDYLTRETNDVLGTLGIIYEGEASLETIRDIAFIPNNLFALTKNFIYLVDPRVPNPYTPATYFIATSRVKNPNPDLMKLNVDLEGTIWLS